MALCASFGSGTVGEHGEDFAGWRAMQTQPEGIAPGSHSFVVYIVVGSLDGVQATMQELYAAGL